MLCVYPFSLEGGINLMGAKLILSFDCYWTIIKQVELALISADPTPANSTTYTETHLMIKKNPLFGIVDKFRMIINSLHYHSLMPMFVKPTLGFPWSTINILWSKHILFKTILGLRSLYCVTAETCFHLGFTLHEWQGQNNYILLESHRESESYQVT